MTTEVEVNVTYISDLVEANPADSDYLNVVGSQLRIIKKALANTFPNITGEVSLSQTQINNFVSRTGEAFWWFGSTPKAGSLAVNGDTIGSASSGATHTGTTYQALFDHLWANGTNTTCPMLTYEGNASTRGASASADWAANKRLTLPNLIHGGTPVQASGDLGQTTHGAVLAHTHGLAARGDGTIQYGTQTTVVTGSGTAQTATNANVGTDNLAAGAFWMFCIFY